MKLFVDKNSGLVYAVESDSNLPPITYDSLGRANESFEELDWLQSPPPSPERMLQLEIEWKDMEIKNLEKELKKLKKKLNVLTKPTKEQS